MNRDFYNAPLVLLTTSSFNFVLHLREQPFPRLPTDEALDKGKPGSWNHSGKDWWTEFFRENAQYFSKLVCFYLWWRFIGWPSLLLLLDVFGLS